MPEKTKIIFLNGEVFVHVSKEDIESHTKVKGELFAVLYQLARELDFGCIYQDGILLTNELANLSTNPDAVGACWGARSNPRKPRQRNATVSTSNSKARPIGCSKSCVQLGRQRRRDLKAAYFAAGIPEYWLVDARSQVVHFTIFARRKTNYVAVPDEDGWQFSKVFGREFCLSRTRNQLGLWN